MLATLIDKPFNSDEWIFEIKWDGYRILAQKSISDILLFSRNDILLNEQFDTIAGSLNNLPYSAVFDGEIVIVDDEGRSSFQLLQQYLKNKKGSPIYYVFDLLYFQEYSLLNVPLILRKDLLNKIIPELDNIKVSDYIDKEGIDFFNIAAKNRLEGIMAKKKNSIYFPDTRSHDWLKIKTRQKQEVIICGYTEPKESKKKIGSLVTGVFEKGSLIFTGLVGGGLDEQDTDELKKKLDGIVIKKAPFKTVPKLKKPATWVKPLLVAEIEFAEWTEENLMRQPVFLGLRDDKPASSVFQEKPEPITISNAIKVEITNPDKIFWSQEGFTKKDLADYYKNIADFILPYLVDRPQSLNRCPDGINGECFFQKNIEHELPGWLKTEKIFSESKNKDVNYLVCSGIDSLLYMINLGCIEINPWNSRIGKPENPDYAVLDLDPLNVSFSDVVKVALNVKQVLDKIGIVGFCKTSGARGIHVYLPLEAKYSYEQALDFTKILATIVNENIPELTSLERVPDKRHNKVYIDCYQNRIGQTMVAPYSIRPRELAPVSTPLHWDELNNNLMPSNFTIKNIFKRLEKAGDLWKGVLGPGIDLEKCINSLYRIYNIR